MITLEQIKDHLRLEHDDATEDDYLLQCRDAALDYVSQYLNGLPDPMPKSVEVAALMIVADLYENREGQIVGLSVTPNGLVTAFLDRHRSQLGI